MKKAIVVFVAALALTLASHQKASAGSFSFSCGFNFCISWSCNPCCPPCCNPCCPPCGCPALGPSCPDCFGGFGGMDGYALEMAPAAAPASQVPAGRPDAEKLPVGPKPSPAGYLQQVNYYTNPYAGYYQNAGYYYGGYGSQAAPSYWYGY